MGRAILEHETEAPNKKRTLWHMVQRNGLLTAWMASCLLQSPFNLKACRNQKKLNDVEMDPVAGRRTPENGRVAHLAARVAREGPLRRVHRHVGRVVALVRRDLQTNTNQTKKR